jgi:hypothetical protein
MCVYTHSLHFYLSRYILTHTTYYICICILFSQHLLWKCIYVYICIYVYMNRHFVFVKGGRRSSESDFFHWHNTCSFSLSKRKRKREQLYIYVLLLYICIYMFMCIYLTSYKHLSLFFTPKRNDFSLSHFLVKKWCFWLERIYINTTLTFFLLLVVQKQ